MTGTKNSAALSAILAAALYAVNIPVSKLLIHHVSPTMMAALLYLGAGAGLFIYGMFCKLTSKDKDSKSLTKKELPYTVAMVVLDVAAPILLMMGIVRTDSANVSLLNNFEIVATSLIAFFIFKEVLSKRLWIAIVLVTVASVILGFNGASSFDFNSGSLFVLAAAFFWGLENNCTRMISNKSSVEIVTIKGCFSGLCSLIIAFILGERLPRATYIIAVLILGFLSYGMSINFYILAQKDLGAAKTSAYYSVAPFLGVIFSLIFLGERPGLQFYTAMLIMIFSTLLIIKDNIELQHTHSHVHVQNHTHRHKDIIHTHEHIHEHSHPHVHSSDGKDHTHSMENPDMQTHNHTHHMTDIT